MGCSGADTSLWTALGRCCSVSKFLGPNRLEIQMALLKQFAGQVTPETEPAHQCCRCPGMVEGM